MKTLFRNKYRIPSARLQTWSYGLPGMYFVTICTANRVFYFGEIVQRETRCIASPQNQRCIASPQKQECIASPQKKERPKQQMRLSAIGEIASAEWYKTVALRPDMNLQLREFVVMPNHIHGIIIIGKNDYNQFDSMENQNRFGPQSKNLASVLRGYKSAVTTFARENNIPFGWQARYHDHMIRSRNEYYRIAMCIVNNPDNWKNDKFHP